MAFQYSITAIGTIVVQSCLNILGSTAAAGFAAASKIEQVFTQAYVALGTTMATYCAQNMGAGKYTRIRKGFKSATLIGFIYAVVTGVIIFFVGKYMTIFFVSENVNQIMEYVDIYLRCVKSTWGEDHSRIDPRETVTTQAADIHLKLLPGTDGALALSMAQVIIEEGLYDKEFVEKYVYGFEEYKAYVNQFPPEKQRRSLV